MEINAFLLFGIDYRFYLRKHVLTAEEYSCLLKRIRARKSDWKKYGKQVFPQCYWEVLQDTLLDEYENAVKAYPDISFLAQAARQLINRKMELEFGSLCIKRELTTSQIICFCNKYGISRDIFDTCISYRERKDFAQPMYPVYCVEDN